MFNRILIVLILMTTLVSCERWKKSPYKSSYKKTPKKENRLQYIFHSKDGNLASDSNKPDQYILTLYNVDKTVSYYIYEQERKSGKMSMDQFIENWDIVERANQAEASNAALLYKVDLTLNKKHKFSEIPVILTNPFYQTKVDRLIFHIKITSKDASIQSGNLGEVTLFINGEKI